MNVEEEIEQSGWKLLHGDVFRPPSRPMALAVLAGSAAQMLLTLGIVSVFSMLGMVRKQKNYLLFLHIVLQLAPPNRGGMLTAVVVLYLLLGTLAGYVTARLYRQFKGTRTVCLLVRVVFCSF